MKASSFYHRYKEIILGVAMIALAAVYLYYSQFIRTRSTVRVSARLIPEILGAVVLLLGFLQFLAGLRYLARARRENAGQGIPSVFMNEEEKKDFLPIVLTFVLIIGYALIFEPLGFVISSILCMFFQMMILAPDARRKPLSFFIISVAVAIVVYIAFRKGLNLSLPPGLLYFLPI